MPIETWLAFVAASGVLLVIPGPTILTVISYSVAHGRRANAPLVAAVALGDSTALVLSLIGLGSVLAASAFAFAVVKWVGGLYLVFLGVKMLAGAARPAEPKPQQDPAGASRSRLFLNTYAVTALNPKGMVFFVAFLPQFLSIDRALGPQLWILSITFVALATVNAGLYANFAASARRRLDSTLAQRRFNLVGGSLLTAAGVWALMARRPG